MANRSIAKLECVTEMRTKVGPTIILLHGYGANCDDLAPLSRYLDPHNRFNWVFPNGSLNVPIGPGYEGRGWFPINMFGLQQVVMTGNWQEFMAHKPPGISSAAQVVRSLVEELKKEVDGPIVLGGFSQGAMTACEAVFCEHVDVQALILMSGALVNRAGWEAGAKKSAKLPFIQSHGYSDPVLGFHQAKELHKLLMGAGLTGPFIDFAGGHEIPQKVLDQARTLIENLR